MSLTTTERALINRFFGGVSGGRAASAPVLTASASTKTLATNATQAELNLLLHKAHQNVLTDR
jgi:hypothetical protein